VRRQNLWEKHPLSLPQLPRSTFVPLAQTIAHRFAKAASYYSRTGEQMYFFLADKLVSRYSMHELQAALAILASREGGLEFALTKRPDGKHVLIQGGMGFVQHNEMLTGHDTVFHVHTCHLAQCLSRQDQTLSTWLGMTLTTRTRSWT